jgi:hypothetical protein
MDHRKDVLAEIPRHVNESANTEYDVVKLIEEEVRHNYSGSILKYNVFLKDHHRKNKP